MNYNVKAREDGRLLLCSRFCILYFFVTIILVGAPLSLFLILPFSLLALVIPQAKYPANQVMLWGVRFLLHIQPWFKGDLDIQIPEGGVLVVSNHRSNLDAFLLLAYVSGVRVLAKHSLFFIPG